jgi:hypothetical protein
MRDPGFDIAEFWSVLTFWHKSLLHPRTLPVKYPADTQRVVPISSPMLAT